MLCSRCDCIPLFFGDPHADHFRLSTLIRPDNAAVQEYIESLRLTGTAVNTTVVMGAAEGIVAARDVTKLRQHDGKFYGGHINITKSLARSLLNQMGYVKRKCSTAGKCTISEFDEVKEVFLADVAGVAVMRNIPKELIFNCWAFNYSHWKLDNAQSRSQSSANCTF